MTIIKLKNVLTSEIWPTCVDNTTKTTETEPYNILILMGSRRRVLVSGTLAFLVFATVSSHFSPATSAVVTLHSSADIMVDRRRDKNNNIMSR